MPESKQLKTSQRIGRKSRYLTTSIPYENAPPHVGFAMEMIQADCLARFYRLEGHTVRFQSGTDENSLKNVQAAEAMGLSVQTLVGRNADRFYELKDALDLSFDDFIRTSVDLRHRGGVQRLWVTCSANQDVYKRSYSGLYCIGCEQFYKPSELSDGCCPEHGTTPEEVSEENYFFRLSRYQVELRRIISSGEVVIVPESRRNEVLAWIDSGLEDFSISRSATRARGWGIPVPGDPDQVIYVWFDALGNYITALDYGTDGGNFAILVPCFRERARHRKGHHAVSHRVLACDVVVGGPSVTDQNSGARLFNGRWQEDRKISRKRDRSSAPREGSRG